MQWGPVRDAFATLFTITSGGAGGVGMAAKKALIADDSSFLKKAGVMLLASVASQALIPVPWSGLAAAVTFVTTKPGSASEAELQGARQSVVDKRYD